MMLFCFIGGGIMPKFWTACLLMILSQNSVAKDESYVIDDSHFSLGFLVEHAGYAKTLGLFKHIDGSFSYDQENNIVKNIKITVNTDSVFTNHEKRDAHLRSPDFLDVKNYPTMTFASGVTDLNMSPGIVEGELTLLGQSRPLTLKFQINKIAQYPFRVGLTKPMVIGVSASTEFNRSDFGMTYAVDKNLVGDKIELIIEFEAIRQ